MAKKFRELTDAEFEEFEEMMSFHKNELRELRLYMSGSKKVGTTKERMEKVISSADRGTTLIIDFADMFGIDSFIFAFHIMEFEYLEKSLKQGDRQSFKRLKKLPPVFIRYYNSTQTIN